MNANAPFVPFGSVPYDTSFWEGCGVNKKDFILTYYFMNQKYERVVKTWREVQEIYLPIRSFLHRDKSKHTLLDPTLTWNSVKMWFYEGKLHSELGPALFYNNNKMKWLKHDKLHREDGPALINNNLSQWWINGGKHREYDRPAVIYRNKYMEWWRNGKRHRTRGPAVACSNRYSEWWIKGNKLDTNEVIPWLKENNINLTKTDDEKLFEEHFE